MGFLPTRADSCIWTRENLKLKCYEYVAVYVDDLCITAEKPEDIVNTIKTKYKLKVKVKGDGKLSYHLGADCFRDQDGTMVCQPKKYIESLNETYTRLFKDSPPKGLKTPLDKNDHPELDTSDLLEGESVN